MDSFSFETRGQKINVQTAKDYVAKVPEERAWTVEGLLPESGLVVLGGRYKQGKSTLALWLCQGIAAGGMFLARTVTEKPTVYVNYEMPPDYLASLLSAGTIPDKFLIVDRPEPQLQVDTVLGLIEQFKIRGFEKGLLVIDSFRGAFKLKGEEENSSGVAGVLLRQLQEIAIKTTWLVLVIHHRNKNSEQRGADGLSGTGDWGAACDVILIWERNNPLKPGNLSVEGRMPPIEPLEIDLSPQECTL